MSIQKILESFDKRAITPSLSGTQQKIFDEIKTVAYERGYASGWDDAISTSDVAKKRIDAELERTLSSLQISYSEVVEHFRSEICALVETIIHKFTPKLAEVAVIEGIKEEIMRQSESVFKDSLRIVCSQECAEYLNDFIQRNQHANLVMEIDHSLANFQARLVFTKKETEFNFHSIILELEELMSSEDFLSLSQARDE